ncbi:MAG: hypothetical protein AB7F21_02705 [Desulfuromonadales bacterium]
MTVGLGLKARPSGPGPTAGFLFFGRKEKEPKETFLFLLPHFAAAWYRLKNRPVESLVAPESEKPI